MKVGQTRSTIAPAAPYAGPRQTARLQEATICAARRMLAWGPHRIGWKLGIARSTVYAVLRRAGLHRLAWLHRTTREIVRYEHPRPGALVHLDIKKLGRIPQGGGKRILPGFAETRSGPQRGPRLIRLRPRSRGRPLPLCLRRGLAGRTRRERCCFPGPGACPLRTPRFHGRARPDRQRRLLREPHLHLYGRGTKPAAEAHAALPASDQWQGGGVQQIMQAEWAYQPAVLFQPRAARSAAWLPCVLQITGVHTAASAGPLPPPGCKQRPWELHLAGSGARPTPGAGQRPRSRTGRGGCRTGACPRARRGTPLANATSSPCGVAPRGRR